MTDLVGGVVPMNDMIAGIRADVLRERDPGGERSSACSTRSRDTLRWSPTRSASTSISPRPAVTRSLRW